MKNNNGILVTVFSLLLGTTFLPPSVGALPPQDKQVEQDIRVVMRLIDVTAKDENGNFVINLGKDEFVLEIDGKEIPIVSLDSYFPMPSTETLAQAETLAQPLGTPPRNIVLFFDRSYSSLAGINRAKKAARDFVSKQIEPNDKVMVAGFDRGLKIYQNFTTDSTAVLAAIDLVKAGFHGFSFQGRKDVNSIFTINQPRISDSVRETKKIEGEYDARNYLNGLTQISKYLKAFRGRKTLILMSQGSPELAQKLPDLAAAAATDDPTQDTGDLTPSTSNPDDVAVSAEAFDPAKMKHFFADADKYLTQKVYETVREFNNSNVVIYPIDLAGIRFGKNASFEEGNSSSLYYFADETGGEFFRNSNDIGMQLNRAIQEINHYYVLGFRNEELPDGSYHKLSLRTTRPGVTLKYGKGFAHQKPFSRYTWDERLAHLEEGFNNNPPQNEIDARTKMHFFTLDDGTTLSKVSIEIPVIAGGNKPVFEILGFLVTDGSQLVDAFHKILTFDDVRQNKMIMHSEVVEAKPGSNVLKMAVRDNRNGNRFYWFTRFRVEEPAKENTAAASSIVLMNQDPDDYVLSSAASDTESYEKRLDFPATTSINPLSLLEGRGIVPSVSNEFDREYVVTACMRIVRFGLLEENSRLATNYSLVDAQNNSHTAYIIDQGVTRIPGTKSQLLITRFDMHEVPAGEYMLIANVVDTGTKVFTEQRARLVLK